MLRKKQLRGLVTLLIIGVVLWQIWDRVRINVWLNLPWWGALLLLLVLIVVIERVVNYVLRD
jgi:hypothetical protein